MEKMPQDCASYNSLDPGLRRDDGIRPLPRRRGRPRALRPTRDQGTPELIRKRTVGETVEALDLYLARGQISEGQHRAGLRLRWLFTLRYGAPSLRALDLSCGVDTVVRDDDPAWRAERELEFAQGAERLAECNASRETFGVCVYNERLQNIRELETLRAGLTALERLWRRMGAGKTPDSRR